MSIKPGLFCANFGQKTPPEKMNYVTFKLKVNEREQKYSPRIQTSHINCGVNIRREKIQYIFVK